jgi:predicted nuclease of predicted toxin-antitoxin system
MKLLVDMNLSPRWTELLHDAGWEAVHWSAVGKFNAPDSEVMAYAAQHDYVVLTLDLDFSAILPATHGEKPSVVQIRTSLPVDRSSSQRCNCVGKGRGTQNEPTLHLP